MRLFPSRALVGRGTDNRERIIIPVTPLAIGWHPALEPSFPYIEITPRGPGVRAIGLPGIEITDDRYVIVKVHEIDVGLRFRIVCDGDGGGFRAEAIEDER